VQTSHLQLVFRLADQDDARRSPPRDAACAIDSLSEVTVHPPIHSLDKPIPCAKPLATGAQLWRKGLQALARISPWLMALGLTGAYVTSDRSEWVGLNLSLCIGMVVVALLRFWHVLSEPMPGSR
jgi:hypothetical protein